MQVSAQNGLGLDELIAKISSVLEPKRTLKRIKLELGQSRVRSEIYQLSNVIDEKVNNDNEIEILCEIDDISYERLKKK